MFEHIALLADRIKMKVNQKKTQLLCIHGCSDSVVKSYIETGSSESIESASTLKILGLNFNHEPNATYHVQTLVDKMYSRLWTLRFLKRSGMARRRLLHVYKQILRPCMEYCSTVYNSMIPLYMSDKLETIQKQAIKIIYGYISDTFR